MLPPPDPYELSFDPPDSPALTAPTVVFLGGPPSAHAERLADAILAVRPGSVIVAGP
jgi:hypothetical protein